ncbi:carbonic anhydrase [Dasania marina]|uniref:carbonic anhydrase n=1 Tax=Dasania marina TaxID=471499 RepID=UPI0030DDBC6C|tara:strand:+ start:40236 stop:40853 length:618 start_codon:yes stop_codon:yes gene_type:complete
MITALEALARLKEGNQRFTSDDDRAKMSTINRRNELVGGQAPFAIVLGCSDSRAPAEIIFDHGLGDLFVIRVAGNIVAPSGIGSVEFAAEQFGTRLVIVLGHSDCGAVKATIDQLDLPVDIRSKNLRSIVNRIKPVVEPLLNKRQGCDEREFLDFAVRANIEASVQQLRHGSEILEDLIRNDDLMIVGAEYSLETGVVDFFEVPE